MFPNCWVKGSTSSQKSLGWGSGIVVMTYRSSRKWMFLGIRLSCDFSCRTCYNNPLPTIIIIYAHKNPLVAPSILTKLHHILCCSSFAVPHWLMPPEVAVDSQEIFDAAPASVFRHPLHRAQIGILRDIQVPSRPSVRSFGEKVEEGRHSSTFSRASCEWFPNCSSSVHLQVDWQGASASRGSAWIGRFTSDQTPSHSVRLSSKAWEQLAPLLMESMPRRMPSVTSTRVWCLQVSDLWGRVCFTSMHQIYTGVYIYVCI